MADKALIDLGNLSKPAEILVSRSCDAIGGLVQPWQMRRLARAEIDISQMKEEAETASKQILAAAQIEPSDLAIRAMQRMVSEEVEKQINIEHIASVAIEKLGQDAKPEDVDEDFLKTVFAKGKNVNSELVRELWGSALAMESNASGSIRPSTLGVLERIDAETARLFQAICKALVHSGPKVTLIWCDGMGELVGMEKGIVFDNLMHLQNMGLINYEGLSGYRIEANDAETDSVFFNYFGEPLLCKANKKPWSMPTGKAILTQAGAEISKCINLSGDTKVRDEIIGYMLKQGMEVSTPILPNHPSSTH